MGTKGSAVERMDQHPPTVNSYLAHSSTQLSNGVDLTGLLGDTKEDWGSDDPAGSRGGAPVGSLGDEVPQKLKLKLFCETTHNICVIIQQTIVAVTRVDILNDMTSKILGGHVPPVP